MDEYKNSQEQPKNETNEKVKKRKVIIRKPTRSTDRALTFKKNSLLKTYNAHCRSKKVRKADKVKEHDLERITAAVFRRMQHYLTEKNGGVMINNFGYFGVFRSYNNLKYKIGPKKTDFIFKPENNGLRLRIIYFPYKRDPLLKFWSMDFSFSQVIYKKVKENLLKGKKYKNYLFSLRKLLGDSIESPYRKFDFLTKQPHEHKLYRIPSTPRPE
jgi:hypothetical protein